MQKMNRRILRSLLCLMLVCMFVLPAGSAEVQAATFADINDDSVWVNQSASGRCTLASAVMLMRRYALLRGDSDWAEITEDAIESVAWPSGGLQWSFDYTTSGGVIQVRHTGLSSNDKRKQELIELLQIHPEGVVLYRSGVHAVLLTDYDAVNDEFYCCDPSQARPKARILLTDSYKVSVSNAAYIWYIASPRVSVSDSYRLSFEVNGGSGGPEEQDFVPGTGSKITDEVPSRTGYTFRGWLDEDEMVLYLPGDTIPEDWTNHELKAQWVVTDAAGWKQSGSRWWYQREDGSYVKNAWVKDHGAWYHFDASGYMQTGWIKADGNWYYLSSSGAMAVSRWIGNYYVKANGAMAVSEWVDNDWYYVDENGLWVPGKTKYTEGWVQTSDGWWYRYGNGSYPKDCWKKIDGAWYHFDAKGYMQTGWIEIGSDWYYLKKSGKMAASEWVGEYYLKADGRMAVSEWVDGGKYYVDEHGRWKP